MSNILIEKVVGNAKLNAFHYKVLAICSLLMVADGYDLVSFGSVLPHLMNDWGTDAVTMGLIASLALAGMFVGGLVFAPMADRYGRRKVIVAALAVTSLAAFACSFATGVVGLGILRFVVGLGLGTLVPNFMALAGEFAPKKNKAVFVATVSAFYAVGAVLAALLSIFLEPITGWRGVFWVAGLSLLLLPLVLKHLPESPEYLAQIGDVEGLSKVLQKIDPSAVLETLPAKANIEDYTVATTTSAEDAPGSRIAALFTHGNAFSTIFMWVFFIMTMVLSYALNTWLPKIMQGAGFELGSAMLTLVVLNAGGFIGSVAGGWLAGHISYRKTLTWYYAIAIASFLLLALKPGTVLLNVLLFTGGFAVVGILAIIHAFAVEFYPAHVRSTGVGWVTGTGRVGAIAGPILGGALVAAQLPVAQNFLWMTVPAFVGLAAVLLVTARKFKSPTEEPVNVEAGH